MAQVFTVPARGAALWGVRGRPHTLTTDAVPARVTFPTTPLDVRIYLALGADLTAPWWSWRWEDITSYVRVEDAINIGAGRPDEAGQVNAGTATLHLINTDGRFTRRNPTSPYYGLLTRNNPIRVTVNPGNAVVHRLYGFVNDWPVRWADESGTYAGVTVTCSGVLRRLGRGRALKSAVRRSMGGVAAGDFVPAQYWPMEDGSSATAFASDIVGSAAMSFIGAPNLASNTDLPGSAALPTFPSGTGAVASIPSYVQTGDKWAFQFVLKITTKPSATTTYMEAQSTGNNHPRWIFKLDNIAAGTADFMMYTYDAAGTLTGGVGIPIGGAFSDISEAEFYGHWLMYTVAAWNDPLYPGQLSASFSAQLSRLRGGVGGILLSGGIGTASSFKVVGQDGVGFGHLALFTDTAFDLAVDTFLNADAMSGWAGEMAHTRAARLCREENVPFTSFATQSALMGPQSNATLLDNLRACEAADQGVLYEREFGLAYQSLDERLNAPASLALDFTAAQIHGLPEPADDDQRNTNRATVTRDGGSFGVAENAVSIARDDLRESNVTLNLYADSQCADAAGRIVYEGTIEQERWPTLPLQLHANPELIPAVTAMGYGARATVAHPPAQMPPDTLDLVAEGSAEVITPFSWDLILSTSPNAANLVGRIAGEVGDTDPAVGWLEADSCTLATGVDSTAVSWQVNVTPLASTAADDYPLLMRWEGEVVRVTAMSGASSPQTATVDRSVNGVVKAHPAGAVGELVYPILLTT